MTQTGTSERAEALARQFEAAVEDAAEVFAQLHREQWRLACPGEERTVAAVARHIATAIAFEMQAVNTFANGEPFEPIRWAWLHELNATSGATNAEADVNDTLTLLRRNASVAARGMRALTDAQLDRRGVYVEDLPEWTVAEMLEHILVGHIRGHLASIRAAVA